MLAYLLIHNRCLPVRILWIIQWHEEILPITCMQPENSYMYDHTTRKGFRIGRQFRFPIVKILTACIYIYWNYNIKSLYILLSYTFQTSALYLTFMNKHLQYTCKYYAQSPPLRYINGERECGGTTPCWWIPLNSMKTTCLASREPR